MLTKQAILQTLARFIAQRPGLEFGNYGDVSAYRSEMRSITRDRHIAEQLLSYVATRDSITADRILAAARDLADALQWALDQIEDDLDPCHQQALAHARAVLAQATGAES